MAVIYLERIVPLGAAKGYNRPTKIHTFLMNCRAPVLGKQLLQTPNPRTRFATPLRSSRASRLACCPTPFASPPLQDSSYPSPPPFTYTRVVLTRTLVLYHCASSFRRRAGPGFRLAVSAVCHLTRACTHARRGTSEDKRALHRSAFVVATSEESQDGDDRDSV